MTDDDSVITRSPSEDPTITDMVFDVADNSTLRDGSDREDIADHEIGLFAAIHELTGIHALGGDEELLLVLEPERVSEGDAGQRGAPTRVVDDLGDDSLEIAVALAEVEAPEPRRTFAVVGVGLEDGAGTLTLSSDHTTHFTVCLCVC